MASVRGCLAAVITLTSAVLVAQTQPPVRDPRLYRSGIDLTSISATVTDRDGRLVTDVTREAFEVYEDGVLQQVTQFAHERVPVGLGVLLDISDSMFGKR